MSFLIATNDFEVESKCEGTLCDAYLNPPCISSLCVHFWNYVDKGF